MLLATRILLYSAPMACGKIARDRRLARRRLPDLLQPDAKKLVG
jgi:hypothetical protein